MAKKESTLQKFERENPELVQEAFEKHLKEEPELTNTAISIIPRGEKKYALVSVKFNPMTKESGEVVIVQDYLDKYEAQYQFKMLAVKLELF